MFFRLCGAIAVIALLILGFGAQIVFGNPVDSKRLYAANDNVQDTIVARSGSYDPCCNYMDWADTVHCNNTYSYYREYYEYRGTSVSHYYNTAELNPNATYTDGGQGVYVGPSSSNELVIRKDSIPARGCLGPIIMRAYYYDGTPGRPSGH